MKKINFLFNVLILLVVFNTICFGTWGPSRLNNLNEDEIEHFRQFENLRTIFNVNRDTLYPLPDLLPPLEDQADCIRELYEGIYESTVNNYNFLTHENGWANIFARQQVYNFHIQKLENFNTIGIGSPADADVEMNRNKFSALNTEITNFTYHGNFQLQHKQAAELNYPLILVKLHGMETAINFNSSSIKLYGAPLEDVIRFNKDKKTLEDYNEWYALHRSWGARNYLSFLILPANQEIFYYYGRCAPQGKIGSGLDNKQGGGLQVLLAYAQELYIVGPKKIIPGDPYTTYPSSPALNTERYYTIGAGRGFSRHSFNILDIVDDIFKMPINLKLQLDALRY